MDENNGLKSESMVTTYNAKGSSPNIQVVK